MNTLGVVSGPDGGWVQLPPGPAPRDGSLFLRWALVVVPLGAALRHLDVEPWRVALLALVVMVGLSVVRTFGTRRVGVVSTVALGALVLAVAVGPRAASLAAASAVMWTLVTRSFRHSAEGTDQRAFRPAVGPLLVADALLLAGGRIRLAAVLMFLAGVLCIATVARPRAMVGVADIGDRGGRVVALALGAVAMVPAAVLVIVMSGLYRLVRFDPLRPRSLSGPIWSSASGRFGHVERGIDPDAELRVGRQGRRRRGLAGTIAVVGVVAVALGFFARPAPAPESEALTARWWPDLWAEQTQFNANPSFDNTTVWRLGDFSSSYVNQIDGRRRTWQPPACDCERLTVWWFGGSAAWGFFQRDDETIPSEMARLAWSRGVVLDIENFALPGYSLAQEMQLFAQMSVTEPAPDLAVFYDGANELFLQEFRNNRGEGADESPSTYAETQLDRFVRVSTWPQRLWWWRSDASPAPPPEPDPALDAPDVARHAMARYRRQVQLARSAAEAAGIPVLFVWQPNRSTVPDAVAAEWEPMDPPDAEWHRRLAATAREELPAGVVDLSDAFDGVDEPIFPDWAHTNERGAEVVAAALLDDVLQRSVDPAR